MDIKDIQTKAHRMVALSSTIFDGMIRIIENAPMGCGMIAKENNMYCEMIMGTRSSFHYSRHQ